jgi:hypothetical protein
VGQLQWEAAWPAAIIGTIFLEVLIVAYFFLVQRQLFGPPRRKN